MDLFFLLPLNYLEGLFFILIASVFGYGLWQNRQENNAEEIKNNITKFKSFWKLGAGSFQEFYLLTTPLSEKRAERVPGMLLSLGLLGTFIGVSIAVSDAAEVVMNSQLGENNVTNTLLKTLSGLGTQFKTSIWGLTASIAFRFLNKNHIRQTARKEEIYGILAEEQKIKLKKEQEDAEQIKKYNERRDNQLLSTIESINLLLYDTLQPNHDAILAQLSKVTTSIKLLDTASSNMETAVRTHSEAFSSSNKEFISNIISFKDVVTSFSNGVQEFRQDVRTTMEDVGDQFENISKNLNKSVAELNDSIKTSFDTFDKSVTKTLSAIDKSMVESSEILRREVGSLTSVVDQQLGKLHEDMGNLNGHIESLKKQFKRMNAITASMDENQEKLKGEFNALHKYISKSLGSAKTVQSAVDRFFSDEGPFATEIDKLSTAITGLNTKGELGQIQTLLYHNLKSGNTRSPQQFAPLKRKSAPDTGEEPGTIEPDNSNVSEEVIEEMTEEVIEEQNQTDSENNEARFGVNLEPTLLASEEKESTQQVTLAEESGNESIEIAASSTQLETLIEELDDRSTENATSSNTPQTQKSQPKQKGHSNRRRRRRRR